MKSGLKYTQSFGKCSEQDMTLSNTCFQRAVGLMQDGSKEKGALTCEQPVRTERRLRSQVVHGRSAPVTGRASPVRIFRSVQKVAALKSSKRSGTAENCSRETGCQAFVFGRMQNASRTKMEAFFIPCPLPLVVFERSRQMSLAALPLGKKGKR